MIFLLRFFVLSKPVNQKEKKKQLKTPLYLLP